MSSTTASSISPPASRIEIVPLAPAPSHDTPPTSPTNDDTPPPLERSSTGSPESCASTVPHTEEEKQWINQRVEIREIRFRQLSALTIEASEKLKAVQYEWMAKPIITLIQPLLHFVSVHEDRFDSQIHGIYSVNRRVAEDVTGLKRDVAGLKRKVGVVCEKVDAVCAKVDTMWQKIDEVGLEVKGLGVRVTNLEKRFDRMDTKLDEVLSLIKCQIKMSQ